MSDNDDGQLFPLWTEGGRAALWMSISLIEKSGSESEITEKNKMEMKNTNKHHCCLLYAGGEWQLRATTDCSLCRLRERGQHCGKITI